MDLPVPINFKPFGLRVEFDNMECSSDKREPFEIDIPIEKKEIFVYLCERQYEFNVEKVLNDYLKLKKMTLRFQNPLIYYYRFFLAINVNKKNNSLIASWKEINMDVFEYFIGMRFVSNDDHFVIKPLYVMN
jgi:hypothetical protein